MQAEIPRNWATYKQAEELSRLSRTMLHLELDRSMLDLSGDYKLACTDTGISMTGPEMPKYIDDCPPTLQWGGGRAG